MTPTPRVAVAAIVIALAAGCGSGSERTGAAKTTTTSGADATTTTAAPTVSSCVANVGPIVANAAREDEPPEKAAVVDLRKAVARYGNVGVDYQRSLADEQKNLQGWSTAAQDICTEGLRSQSVAQLQECVTQARGTTVPPATTLPPIDIPGESAVDEGSVQANLDDLVSQSASDLGSLLQCEGSATSPG